MAEPAENKPIRAAIYATVDRADEAVRKLLDAGFDRDQVTVLCSEEAKEKHFRQFEHEDPAGSHTGEAAVGGATIGAVLGGLTSAGIATATGVPIAAAGPSFLIGGAVAGGLVGAMTTRGEEKELADFYDQAVTKGRILVAVENQRPEKPVPLQRAEEIFAATGAEPIELSKG